MPASPRFIENILGLISTFTITVYGEGEDVLITWTDSRTKKELIEVAFNEQSTKNKENIMNDKGYANPQLLISVKS